MKEKHKISAQVEEHPLQQQGYISGDPKDETEDWAKQLAKKARKTEILEEVKKKLGLKTR